MVFDRMTFGIPYYNIYKRLIRRQHGKDSLFGHCNDSTEVSLRGILRHCSG